MTLRTATEAGNADGDPAHHRMAAIEHEPGIEGQPPAGKAQWDANCAALGALGPNFGDGLGAHAIGGRLLAPMPLQRGFHLLQRADARTVVLVRHARSGVPWSAGLKPNRW